MSKHPSVEALVGVHTFPGPYLFKLFGPHDQSFVDSIRAKIAPHVADEEQYTLTLRPSSKGALCVVSVEVQVDSPEHVQAIYSSFHEVEGLRTML